MAFGDSRSLFISNLWEQGNLQNIIQGQSSIISYGNDLLAGQYIVVFCARVSASNSEEGDSVHNLEMDWAIPKTQKVIPAHPWE